METKKISVTLGLSLILLMFATISWGCYQIPDTRGPGNYVKEDRMVGKFSSLEIGGAFKVFLTQGKQESLTVEADENEIGEIVTEIAGSKLKIYLKPGCRGKCHEMTLYVTFVDLHSVDFSGAVEVVGTHPLTFADLDMQISGAAEITLDMAVEKLDAEFSGASEVELKGTCKRGIIEISGASDFNADELEFGDLDIGISGAADARLLVTGNLDVDASGASSVRHSGGAKVTSHVSGASSVKAI